MIGQDGWINWSCLTHTVAERRLEQKAHTATKEYETFHLSKYFYVTTAGERWVRVFQSKPYLWWGWCRGGGADRRRWIPAPWTPCHDLLCDILATLIGVTDTDLGGQWHKRRRRKKKSDLTKALKSYSNPASAVDDVFYQLRKEGIRLGGNLTLKLAVNDDIMTSF